MDAATLLNAIWGVLFIIVLFVVAFARRRRRRIGSAASGTMYDWQSQDQRRAMEIIVEERAEARRPEYPDGNLPDLEQPRR
jgi:hypothetical protein